MNMDLAAIGNWKCLVLTVITAILSLSLSVEVKHKIKRNGKKNLIIEMIKWKKTQCEIKELHARTNFAVHHNHTNAHKNEDEQ